MISEKHAQLYRAYYAGVEIPLRRHTWQHEVDELVAHHGFQSVLDYGSGPSHALAAFAGYPVVSYDPGVETLAARPLPAELVVCHHVLEHIEPAQLDAVLEDLLGLALRMLFLRVACVEAPKRLADGTPWHTLVRAPSWWEARLRGVFPGAVQQDRGAKEFGFIWMRP